MTITKISFTDYTSTTTKVGLWDWLNGHKTYIVLAVGAAKLWYMAIFGHPWSDAIDTALNETLVIAFGAAIRSALKTTTAQVMGAVATNPAPAQPAELAQTVQRTMYSRAAEKSALEQQQVSVVAHVAQVPAPPYIRTT